MSFFSDVPLAPPNSILGLALQCKNDHHPDKIDLTIGAYRGEDGQPWVLPAVKKAEMHLNSLNMDHEYLPQDGHLDFVKNAQILMFGEESRVLLDNCVASIQALSGTGALRLAAEFFAEFYPSKVCYIPSVTWPNHPAILHAARVSQATYRYLNSSMKSLDFAGFVDDLESCPVGSIVLLHSCAHNPSGVDPSEDEWRQILEVMQRRGLFPFFDNAYQGFVSGCPSKDAFAVRLFAEAGMEMVVACSFAKNFGLYGQRVGCLHMVVRNSALVPVILSQLRALARTIYSTCPSHGARIVSLILGNKELREEWEMDCASMATRIETVRFQLFQSLKDHQVEGSWDHIVAQRGMFSNSGISRDAVVSLREQHHVYMVESGRISLAGLNSHNVERFVLALVDVLGRGCSGSSSDI